MREAFSSTADTEHWVNRYDRRCKAPFETLVLTVERIGHHCRERDTPLHGQLHQPRSYLQLGALLRVVLASTEVVRGSVRLEVHRIVRTLIRPQAADAHHPVVSLADVGQPLPADVDGVLAPFAVAVFVYDQDALLARSGRGPFEQDLQPAFVGLLLVPSGL